ncbi:nuclear transport factor 2 family protein [Aquimarina sp. MMG016]|uniref:nuclear transport factor 2 family protein n=1 Tax=Aquimarina sp. MMG016 TaxID=2822690 RepID=UPI001B3A490F|nr:nuclear transport factor 2 family protein [Aquimarina sp. MMG016]MBQ4821883.1 nuclear transport factor 2 family protein [Aquimarina sp. MMG016]
MKRIILIIVIISALGCQTKKDMNEQRKQVIESYIKSYNNFDINGMTKDLTENVVFENVSNGNVELRTEGIKEFIKQAESAKQYFTERKQTVQSWEFNNSKVIVGIDYKAILAVDLPNGMKTGDTLKLKGKSEFEFANEKIKSITDKS